MSSNCVAPFAWSRLVGTIPINSEADAERIEKAKQSTPAKIAPLVAGLATEEGRKITGQIFGVRGNEVVLFDQPRPVKSVARLEGWNPETLLDQCMPAMQADFTDLGATASVFPYDPI